jgi:ketosteroid isomerase-like protein
MNGNKSIVRIGCALAGAVALGSLGCGGASSATPAATSTTGATALNRAAPDEATVRELNDGYVQAFLKADVAWYKEHVAEDFVCVAPDGSLLHKAEFLAEAGQGPGVADYHLEEVKIRVIGAAGDVALVHAKGLATRKDGTKGTSRYTDIYERRGGTWIAVSAQVTRTPG